jgi:lysophospholipase L1-like esterase
VTRRWTLLAWIVLPLLLLVSAAVILGPGTSSTSGDASRSVPPKGAPAVTATSPVPRGTMTTIPPAAPLEVVGLGDSVMSGTNCNCAGIVAEYAAALQQRDGRAVTGNNLGVPGDTTSDLLDHLQNDDAYRAAVRGADVVLVTIGANDLAPQWQQWQAGTCDDKCYDPAVAAMSSRLDQILTLIRSLRSGPPATVLVTNYWNVFTDGDVARASGGQDQIDWSQDITLAANSGICVTATEHNATCVDLYTPIQDGDPTDVLAPDGDHPNAAGVGVIVRALMADTPKE